MIVRTKKREEEKKTVAAAVKGREKEEAKKLALSLMNNISRERWLINFQQEAKRHAFITFSLPLPA